MNKRVFEALVKSGACDGLTGAQEGSPLAACGRVWPRASTRPASTATARSGTGIWGRRISSAAATAPAREINGSLPAVPAWTEIEQLNFEKESLGLFWSGHPVDRYAADLAAYGAKGTHELAPRLDASTRAPAVRTQPATRPAAGAAGPSRAAGKRSWAAS